MLLLFEFSSASSDFMFGVKARIVGGINLDKLEVEVDCPRCKFPNPIWLKQARLRDVIICRGCKANIQLDDSMNTVRKGVRSVHQALDQLHEQIESINRIFR